MIQEDKSINTPGIEIYWGSTDHIYASRLRTIYSESFRIGDVIIKTDEAQQLLEILQELTKQPRRELV